MKILALLLLMSCAAFAQDPTPSPAVPGLVDSNGREYLADLRQIGLWLVGLTLVSLTAHGFRPV